MTVLDQDRNLARQPIHNEEEVMSNTMEISVGEIMDLAAWVEKQGLKRSHPVTVEYTQTGIGTALEAKIKLTEDSGIFKDFTDYESW
jgi:hypothetical protein